MTIMKANMGSIDRIIRTFIALAFGVLYFMDIISGTLGIVFVAVATVFAITSLVSFCPLYALLGVNTCGIKKIN
jgi:Protein of unknown function (DUF2892)